MSNLTLYRTGIIGLGRIGYSLQFDKLREQPASHSSAFGQHPRIQLAGGCDTNPDTLRRWQSEYSKANTYQHCADMMKDGQWDIVVIAVNEQYHLSVFETVAAYCPRLIVLEKPIAPNLKEVLTIQQLAMKQAIPVQVNHQRRFSRDYLAARKIITSARYGELKSITGNLFTRNPAWRKHDFRLAEGSLLDDGTHLIDIIGFLTGFRPRLSAFRFTPPNSDDNISGITAIGNAGKTHLTLNIGFETDHFTFEIDLIFAYGRIHIGNGIFEVWESKPSPYYQGFHSLRKNTSIKPFYPTGYFFGMVQNSIDFLDGKAELGSPLNDAVDSFRVFVPLINEITKETQVAQYTEI